MSKKPYIHKRLIAYFLDILIISIIASVLALPFTKDVNNGSYNELLNVVKKYQAQEISEEEYLILYDELNYDLTKSNVSQTIVISVVSLLYFVVVNYYYNGQTIGKKLMKLKLTSIDEKKLPIYKYLIRTLVGSTTLSNITTVVLVLALNKQNYLLYESKFTTVFGLIYVLCFVFALYRNDGRGLHDLIAGTKVVNVIEEKEEIKEAVVIEEKNNVKEEKENKNDKKKVKKETSKKSKISKKDN